MNYYKLMMYAIETFDKVCTTIHSYGVRNQAQYKSIPMKYRVMAKKWITAKDNLGTPMERALDQTRRMRVHNLVGHKVNTVPIKTKADMVLLGKIVKQ